MSFKFNVVVFITVCLSYQSRVCGLSAGEVNVFKAKIISYAQECAVEHPVSAEEMLKVMKDHQSPETENVKCMLACVFKKTGMIDDEGKLVPEGIRELAQMASAEKHEVVKNTEDFLDACFSVNDQEVSGDKKICERAAMIFECSVKQAQAAKSKP